MFPSSLTVDQNKLERLSLAIFFQASLILVSKPTRVKNLWFHTLGVDFSPYLQAGKNAKEKHSSLLMFYEFVFPKVLSFDEQGTSVTDEV